MFRLKLSDIVPTKEKSEKMGNIPMPSTLNLIVPVGGQLANPQVNFAEAFVKSMTSEDAVNSILKTIIDSKATKDSAEKPESKEPAEKKSDVKGFFDDILGRTGGK